MFDANICKFLALYNQNCAIYQAKKIFHLRGDFLGKKCSCFFVHLIAFLDLFSDHVLIQNCRNFRLVPF